ncbi:MAG: hypothetical protein COV96_00535 [Candidatus Zambryskibacteria bacterium CG11_big_fil_rev_8_21_14_0_20_42_18]|uniref:Uncharacterized protein n=1 Tax=Candidatus Zambryskibacteria bacterium CG_4_9_14_3_um_filter_42_15 TaxID=1975112 RepID=A0A2M7WS12_9BACT|nr:MAG: hypothetical protein COV96_00535 [Candidatus Zambryskibacteria bacterium CG11_big_fil_rev_8_21_14_0_20_42_18]PJA32666.1 MAG: hypothetical protein CO185_02105 [Candidatus Zambryskibacteria bacterium CG_4_9_14_3_um_filter_42_15]
MRQKGFISWIILFIIALALLKYFFNWSIFDAAATEEGKSTITYIRDVLNFLWSYIEVPARWIWQRILELIPASGGEV